MACPHSHHENTKGSAEMPTQKLETIPQPPMAWFTGNLRELNPEFPNASFWRLADIYGPIYKLVVFDREVVVISSQELVNEVCDDDRFEKTVSGSLEEVRALTRDGLFTAYGHEPNWWKAHRILIPVFGPMPIRKMFPGMLDIASQLVLKWDRMGPDYVIDTADQFTRLAFDTIAWCTFGYRFNEFYTEDVHPFRTEMAEFLIESGKRANRSWLENQLRMWSDHHRKENVQAMWSLCDKIVAARKANPQSDSHDLLDTMLNVVDPETGEKMSEENVKSNMITFLIAGHETTSGTLAFLMYHLTRNPEKLLKAQAEVDKVVGNGALELKHLPQLKYVEACIRETLRVKGPISVIARHSKQDTVIGGRYGVSSKTSIILNLNGLHHDPKIWGDDHDVFRPERMLDGGFEALPPNSWRPFGVGLRACIGRAFAEQEMIMVVALILQRFQVEMADPSYDLTLKSTLTIKPADFNIKARRRPGKDWMVGIPGASTSVPANEQPTSKEPAAAFHEGSKTFLRIVYGSNSGTCKALAEDLQTTANNRAGYNATLETMDHSTEHLPTDGTPVIFIAPSYEGMPPDNAKKFVSWLEMSAADGKENLKGLKYAVFGAGNSEWVRTFLRVPKLVDELGSKLGGSRICPPGFVDVKEDITGPWEDWTAQLWPALSKLTGTEQKLEEEQLKVSTGKPEHVTKLAGEEISHGFVKKNEVLATGEVGAPKRHMEVELPEGMTYRTGDYLVVLPTNPMEEIHRAITRFKLAVDDVVTISGTSKTFLSSKAPITVAELLGTRVELGTPVSQRQLETIAKTASDEGERKTLQDLSSDNNYKEEVLAKRFSILDVLDDFPSCNLDFAAYLDMLKPLAPRQYSISSSPLAKTFQHGIAPQPITVAVTYDVHEAPARSGHNRVFRGVASTYLARSPVGGKVRCFVRPTNASFHLPSNTETPIIMVAAGTGIAPMRGFIEERACLAEAGGKKFGPALLYFGCRDAEKDFIYADELKKWEEAGVVEVRPAFSRHGPEGHYKYVPDRLFAEREELARLFMDGAKIFLCGSASKLAKSSNEVVQKIWLEKNPGKTEQDAFDWLQRQREERYVSDVFD